MDVFKSTKTASQTIEYDWFLFMGLINHIQALDKTSYFVWLEHGH